MTDALVIRPADGGLQVTDAGLAAIEQMAANGAANSTIARALGTSTKAFAAMLKEDGDPRVLEAYSHGKGQLADECISTLLTHMRGGNVTACIFACKSLLGLRDVGPATQAPANAVQVNIQLVQPMSQEEFTKLVESKEVPHGLE